MRLAERLLLSSLVTVSVLVLLIVTLSGQRLRGQLVAQSAQQLTREARLVATEWTEGTAPDVLANVAGHALGHRVTLVDTSGRVTGDSEFDGPALDRLENHRHRPEIEQATRESVGVSNRLSPSAGDRELYVAIRSPRGWTRVSMTTRELDEIVGSARRDVLISGLVALLFALGFAALFARSVSRPIVELRDVAQGLAAGDLSRRPALASTGEVGDLAGALHRMAEQLAARLQALQSEDTLLNALIESLNEGVLAVDGRRQVVRINANGRRLLSVKDRVPFSATLLPRDHTLRDALAEALAGRAYDHAETNIDGRTLALTARPLGQGTTEGAVIALFDLTAVRRLELVRRDFVANVSHELKTPLTVIGGFAETLETDEVPDEQRTRFIKTIRANTDRMQRIVDDLLDLSRIESGGWVPTPTSVDLRAAASDVLTAAAPLAQSKSVALDIALPSDAATLWADQTAVRQILGNLVGNAIRYTPAGGSVTVFARRESEGISIGVRDSGIGIAAEHLPRIFERFYRADPARAREEGGTGLGLAIVRHLVEAHGGRVGAESTIGRGTTVTAFFPAAT